MAIFSNWFKSKQDAPGANGAPRPGADAEATPEAEPTPTPVAAVRTVKPNSVQPVRASGPTARSPISLTGSPGAAAHAPTTRKITFGGSQPPPPPPELAPQVSYHAEAAPAPAGPDVVVSLELGDFVDRIPTNLLKSGSPDRRQRVEFYSSELYSDLAKGRATVPASVIYQKCPDIFERPISETEDVEVQLPLHRLVEQLGAALAPREDQTPEESVTEIETPFLQVAMEDNARLAKAPGTSVGATVRAIGLPSVRRSAGPAIPPPPMAARPEVETRSPSRTGQVSPISPLKQPMETRSIAAPTAQTAGPINPSKRPPSTVRASVAGGKIRLSAPATNRTQNPAMTPAVPRPSEAPGAPKSFPATTSRVPSVSPSHQVTKKTARIQIPPISLRPAGVGSPRPPSTPVAPPTSTPPPPPPLSGFPRRGPEALTSFKPMPPGGSSTEPPTFRSTPPPSMKTPPPSFSPGRPAGSSPFPALAEPMSDLIRESTPAHDSPSSGVAKDQLIEMGLAAVLRGFPSTALIVEPSSVPESARISLPFGLIEPQLSNGRVSIPLQTFREALPSAFNHVLAGDCDIAEAPIPLQEIFQNLPENAIAQRQDQVIEEVRNAFPTPFSQKAEEDAQRFGSSAVQPAPPVVPAPAPDPELSLVEAPMESAPSAAVEEPLQTSETPVVSEPIIEETPEPLADHSDASELIDAPAEPVLDSAAEPEPFVAEEPAPALEPEPERQEEPLKEAGDPLVDANEDPEAQAPAAEATPLPSLPENVSAVPGSLAETIPKPNRPADSKLQTLFMTEDDLDAKTVARLVSQLPGVESCSVMFDDGLLLASSVPQDGQTEGFSAMAPALFQRVLNFTNELSLGELQGCTLYTDRGLLSLFTHRNICVSVRHNGRGFLPGVREKLAVVTRELAGMYAPADADSAPDRIAN